jgi:TB2/DP1, HVA22 family
MTNIWLVRLAFSKILFNFFGYLSPALNSTKAIISKDEEGIREYLTYWCVFGLLLYVEFLLNFFSTLRNWPPESKVLFILWLTLPQFQGAFRIYNFVLKPYFEKYENEIDKHIDNISKGVSEKAHRHIQTILWQLFLAPNDGLLSGALQLSSNFSSSKTIFSFLSQQDSDPNLADGESRERLPLHQHSSTSMLLQKQLLQNFTEMLVEGIYADVRHSSSAIDSLSPVNSGLCVCRVSIIKGGFHLQITEQEPDDIGSESEASSLPTRNTCTSSSCDSLIVPLALVTEVSSGTVDLNTITINVLCPPLSLKSNSRQKKSVLLTLENETEVEALLAGLTVLCADAKRRALKALIGATQIRKRLAASFRYWRFCGAVPCSVGDSPSPSSLDRLERK